MSNEDHISEEQNEDQAGIRPATDDEVSEIRPATEEELPMALEPEIIEEDEEPISLVDESPEDGEKSKAKVRQLGRRAKISASKEYKRPLNLTGEGATRCRVFESRIALEPLAHMEERINDWLDSEEIEVKHVGHMVGVMEGKTPRPNVVVVVWY